MRTCGPRRPQPSDTPSCKPGAAPRCSSSPLPSATWAWGGKQPPISEGLHLPHPSSLSPSLLGLSPVFSYITRLKMALFKSGTFCGPGRVTWLCSQPGAAPPPFTTLFDFCAFGSSPASGLSAGAGRPRGSGDGLGWGRSRERTVEPKRQSPPWLGRRSRGATSGAQRKPPRPPWGQVQRGPTSCYQPRPAGSEAAPERGGGVATAGAQSY